MVKRDHEEPIDDSAITIVSGDATQHKQPNAKKVKPLPSPGPAPVQDEPAPATVTKSAKKPLPRAPDQSQITAGVRVRTSAPKPGDPVYNKFTVVARVIGGFYPDSQSVWHSGMPADPNGQVYVTFVVTYVAKSDETGILRTPNPVFSRNPDKSMAMIPGQELVLDVRPSMVFTVKFNHSSSPKVGPLKLPLFLYHGGIGTPVKFIDIYPKVVLPHPIGSPELVAMFEGGTLIDGPGYGVSQLPDAPVAVSRYVFDSICRIGNEISVFWNVNKDNMINVSTEPNASLAWNCAAVFEKLFSGEVDPTGYLDSAFRSGSESMFPFASKLTSSEIDAGMENDHPGMYPYQRTVSTEVSARVKLGKEPTSPEVVKNKFGVGLCLRTIYGDDRETRDSFVQAQFLHGSILQSFGIDSASAFAVIINAFVAGRIPCWISGVPSLTIMEKNPVAGYDDFTGVQVNAIIVDYHAWLEREAFEIDPSAAASLLKTATPVTGMVEYLVGGSYYAKPSDNGDAKKSIKSKLEPTVASGQYFERFGTEREFICFSFLSLDQRAAMLKDPQDLRFFFVPNEYGHRVARAYLNVGFEGYHQATLKRGMQYQELLDMFSNACIKDDEFNTGEEMPTIEGLVYVQVVKLNTSDSING